MVETKNNNKNKKSTHFVMVKIFNFSSRTSINRYCPEFGFNFELLDKIFTSILQNSLAPLVN